MLETGGSGGGGAGGCELRRAPAPGDSSPEPDGLNLACVLLLWLALVIQRVALKRRR